MATAPGGHTAVRIADGDGDRTEPPGVEASAHGASEGTEQLRTAVAASARAEASLSALQRAIQQVASGVTGAKEANEHLSAELHRVRELLASTNEQRLALRNRADQLEAELARAHADAKADRDFLIEEQDRFLTALLEEHEATVERIDRERQRALAEVARLEQRRPSGAHRAHTPAGDGDEQLAKLLEERDRSRQVVRRLQTQRDEAQAEATRLAAALEEARRQLIHVGRPATTEPPDRFARRTEPARPHPTDDADVPEPEAALPAGDRPTLDGAAFRRATLPPEPDELAAALKRARRSPASGQPAAKPGDNGGRRVPLKSKPDPSRQSLGGYSLRGDDVADDHVPRAPKGGPR